jgi:hypothetical protein
MRRLITLSLVFTFALLGASQSALAADKVEVMTQNQFLGADLDPVAQAPDFPTFIFEATAALTDIALNNFPERADALARLIAVRQPDLVGLQEVFNYQVNFANGLPPFRDHLADTMAALAAQGENYVVVASVRNLNLTLPPALGIDGDGDLVPDFITIIDRDVILARADIVPPPTPVPYSAFCARPSGDGGPGCNYQFIAVADTPVGPINIERGWVGVDATIDGESVRFVNTHLEVQVPDPTNPLSPVVQAAQSGELIQTLAASTPPGVSLIVVGDINSSEDDPIIPGPLPLPPPFNAGIIPPYTQFVGSGYTDVWTLRDEPKDGFTCCEAEDLRNEESEHGERIDIIFSLTPPLSANTRVLGAKKQDKSDLQGLWPSDHASVVGRISFPEN